MNNSFFCKSCEKTLYHNLKFCPIVNANQTPRYTLWTKCVCLIHTCYDAKALLAPDTKVSVPIYEVLEDDMSSMINNAIAAQKSKKSNSPTLFDGSPIYLSDVILYFAGMDEYKYLYLAKNGTIKVIGDLFKLKPKELAKRIAKMKKGYA